MGWLLFLTFVFVPLIEIGIFIQVGGWIGTWWTLAMILFTALAGSLIIRIQGFGVVNNARQSLSKSELPVDALIHGASLVIAGLLLITPGFFTDTIGFLLLVPAFRLALGRKIAAQLQARADFVVRQGFGGPGDPFGTGGPRGPHQPGPSDPGVKPGPVIDLEAEEIPDDPKDDSPWRK